MSEARAAASLGLASALVLAMGLCATAYIIPSTEANASPRTATNTGSSDILEVSISSMAPSLPKEGTRTVISGQVVNTGDQELVGLRVELGISSSRITTTDGLTRALDPAQNLDTLSLPVEPAVIRTGLRPGAQATWKIVIRPRELGAWSSGVYVLQVRASAEGYPTADGTARVALPWIRSPGNAGRPHPMSVTWLWPLTTPPARDARGILLDETTPRELAPAGRLTALVEAGATRAEQVTWVIDPSLLETADAMSKGYRIVQEGGEPGVPRAGTDANRWLNAVRAATAPTNVRVHPLTYADLDVSSLTATKLAPDIGLANTMAPDLTERLLGRAAGGVLAWPAGAAVETRTIEALRDAGVRQTQLDRSSLIDLSTSASLAAVGSKGGRLTAVVGDPVLGPTVEGLAGFGPVSGVVQRQLFLAQLAVYSLHGDQEAVIIAPTRRWNADPRFLGEALQAVDSVSWLQPVTLDELLDDQREQLTIRQLTPTTRKTRRRELPANYLKTIREQERRLSRIADILTEPDKTTAELEAAILRSESVAWREQSEVGSELVARNGRMLAETESLVRPISGGTVTFAGASGHVPVTVANDFDVPVKVGVRLVGDPAMRLIQEEQVTLELPPGQKISTQIAARVVGAGDLAAKVQLTTPKGEPYGAPSRVTMRTAAYAAAAAYVVAGAFVALAITIVVSTIRRRRTLAMKSSSENAED